MKMTGIFTSERVGGFLAPGVLGKVIEMVEAAKIRVIIASFSDIDERVTRAIKTQSEQQGDLEVWVVLDRGQCDLSRARRAFPKGSRFFRNVDEEIMHVKALVADSSVMIGSNNLSRDGLDSIIELSVAVEDEDLALEVRDFIQSCKDRGILEELGV